MPLPDEHPDPAPRRVSEIPLFPLDLVLFPRMKMSLHIFEPRYKQMIERCLAGSQTFGVVLLRADTPDLPKSPRRVKTHRVGCSAHVTHAERLADGGFNIEIEGVERFRIVEQHEVEAYRTGIVETVHDREPVGAECEIAHDLFTQVESLLEDFLTRQLAALGQRIVAFDFPQDPMILSLITACILPINNPDKQMLLEKTNTTERLDTEREILVRAIARLRRTAVSGARRGDERFRAPATGDETATFEQIHADRYREYVCGN